jgi:hypothetical protein
MRLGDISCSLEPLAPIVQLPAMRKTGLPIPLGQLSQPDKANSGHDFPSDARLFISSEGHKPQRNRHHRIAQRGAALFEALAQHDLICAHVLGDLEA